MNGKCPNCKNAVVTVDIGAVTASFFGGSSFKAVSYNCGSCNTVLGVEIDPIAVRTEIVSQTTAAVLKALGKSVL